MKPGVTMIVATYNRSSLLMQSLSKMAGEGAFRQPDQLIVVDDGGDDDCYQTCNTLNQFGLPVEYVYIEHPGETNPCRARNVGLKLARHEEILTVEPEIAFMTDVVDILLNARPRFEEDCLSGMTYHSDHEGATPGNGCTPSHFPYYLLMKTAWLLEVGGWDEAMPGPWGWDDIDLEGRLRYNGHAPRLIGNARAHHQWHPSRIEPAVANETYARAKELPRDLVANVGKEWGCRYD